MRTLRLILVFILTAVPPIFAAAADLAITPAASGLSSPLAIAAPVVCLDIQPRVSCCNERGLLGMAFHPNFANNGTFYLNYTDVEFSTIIAAYQVSANPDQADFNSEAILLLIPQPFANHNGG
jgi:hypothetical protein